MRTDATQGGAPPCRPYPRAPCGLQGSVHQLSDAEPVDKSPATPTTPGTTPQPRRKCIRQGSEGPIIAVSKTAARPTEAELVRLQWAEALENGCRDPPFTAAKQERFDEAVAKRKAASLEFNKRKSNPAVKQTAAFGKHLGGVDAALCQLLLGIAVSTLNHAKLFQTKSATVAAHFIARIVYEDDESGHVSEIKRRSPRLPGTGFRAELKRFFLYVLEHSTTTVSSFSGRQPYEPWIAGFCEAVVDSELLRDADRSSRPTVAETITEIAHTCLQSVDKEKVEEVERKSEVTLKRKAALKAEAGKRLGFGAYPVPKAGSTVATDAGFLFDDFDEDGELLPDSDWEDEDSEWSRKKARYCKGMEEKGTAMDLKGRTPAQIPGARLTVSYDEDGSGKGSDESTSVVKSSIGRLSAGIAVAASSIREKSASTTLRVVLTVRLEGC